VVTDDPTIREALARMRAALERTSAVGRQLVGLNLHEANELAARSACQLCEVKRNRRGLVVTADLRMNRINVETDGGIVVETSAG
jgi:hypothetical protein